MNHQINRLIYFGLQHHLISEDDEIYAVNLLLDLFHLDHFTKEEMSEELEVATDILEEMLDYACQEGFIENNITERDLFDTRIMNCLMPRPSEVIQTFKEYYKEDSKKATKYFYDLSIASNYIRKTRTDKNIRFKQFYKYGDIEITINLSKPEKDPKEIMKAKTIKASGYPKCLLCKENVGFAGNFNHPARQNHRIIPLMLNGYRYYMQYSPYVYYNEHCIIFNENHQPMAINENTFRSLFSFVKQFPHYMLGSNADLPIVGGSILTHDHFQGGHYIFPIEGATVVKDISLDKYPDLQISVLNWPLSTIRVRSTNDEQMIRFALDTLNKWINYSNEKLDIIAYSEKTRHNTITPIVRKKNGMYEMDLVLRNNRTSEKYPDGIFHPHQNLHHIKKENIGLIEVMGLAVLPARLKDELEVLKECLLGKKNILEISNMKKHEAWYNELKSHDFNEDTVDQLLKEELTHKFVNVLEDAGVFKMNEEGKEAFIKFVEMVGEKG